MSHRGHIQEGSQEGRLLALLQAGREVTPLDALREIGSLRLAARIENLRRAGYAIETHIERRNGKHFAVYSLHRSIDKSDALISNVDRA